MHAQPKTSCIQVGVSERRPRATGRFARRARRHLSFGGETPLPCRNTACFECRSVSLSWSNKMLMTVLAHRCCNLGACCTCHEQRAHEQSGPPTQCTEGGCEAVRGRFATRISRAQLKQQGEQACPLPAPMRPVREQNRGLQKWGSSGTVPPPNRRSIPVLYCKEQATAQYSSQLYGVSLRAVLCADRRMRAPLEPSILRA